MSLQQQREEAPPKIVPIPNLKERRNCECRKMVLIWQLCQVLILRSTPYVEAIYEDLHQAAQAEGYC